MVLKIKTGLGRQGGSSSWGGGRSSRNLLAAMLEGGDPREDAPRDVHLAFRETGWEKKSSVLKIT